MYTRSFTEVLAATAFGCSMMLGCGQGAVDPRLDPVNHISSALSIGSMLEVNGSYGMNCHNRSGSWSSGIAGFSALTNSPLSVIQNDAACSLSISSMRIGSGMTNALYLPTTDIALGSSFAGSGTPMQLSSMDPLALYLNARIQPDLSFSADFTIALIYSDDPALTTGSKAASFAVSQSSVTSNSVTPPDYTLDLSGLGIQVDIANLVQSVSGTGTLTDVMVTGDRYAVTTTNLGGSPSFAAVDADFAAATQHAIAGANPTVAASFFSLVGQDLTSGVQRNVIVRHSQSGTASYERFLVTFNKP